MKKTLFSEIPYLQGKRIILKALTADDAAALQELVDDDEVYRYLPTFLFEKQYDDVRTVIERLYDECIKSTAATRSAVLRKCTVTRTLFTKSALATVFCGGSGDRESLQRHSD